jgi:ketosteroid isomerase-like protein
MNSFDNGAILRDSYAAWNAKDMDKCASNARPDAKMTMPSGEAIPVRDYIENWARAFPDGQITDVRIVAQTGNTVVAEFTARGTHTGPLESPMGRIPPTNRRIEMKMVEIAEFANGKMTGGRAYFDTAGFMLQLGVMPPMATETRQAARPRA